MKILHICTGWPLSYQGGITNYVRNLARTQFDSDNDVWVLGAPDDVEYDFNYVAYSSNIKPFTYCRLVDKQALKRIDEILKREQFDMIHIHALEYIDWDLYSVIKQYHYVVSLHDYCFICPRIYMFREGSPCEAYDEKKCSRCFSYLERFKLFRRGIPKLNRILGTSFKVPYVPQKIAKIRYIKSMELLNNADCVLPVSNRVEEIYVKSGLKAKTCVLHIGNESANEFDENYVYDQTPHVIKIVFLGRLSEYKGADLFLQIAQSQKNNKKIEFHFYGYAGPYEEKLKECDVVNHGSYRQNQLKEILSSFDLGMVLSIWEDNGPQVVMELLNNHIPVIGTKMGGISDFVTMKNGYIFNPYSKSDLDNLNDFLQNLTVDKVAEMKEAILPTITPQKHNEELLALYEDIVCKDRTNK